MLALVVWPPPLEPLIRQGSAQRQFVGLGLGLPALTLAFLHGVVQTGFTEELLLRGLIAGSLSRRLELVWANLIQALIFFFRMWQFLSLRLSCGASCPWYFWARSFLAGVRIRSGSIIGSWLIHASGNVTMALLVAART